MSSYRYEASTVPLQMESAIPVETLSSQLTTTLWLYLEPGKFLDRAAGALSEAVVGSRVLLRLSAAMFVLRAGNPPRANTALGVPGRSSELAYM